VALIAWNILKPSEFWSSRLPPSCEGTRLLNVLMTLVIHRLIDPGSNYHEPVTLSGAFQGHEPVPLSSRDGFVDTRFASRRIQGQVHGSQVCFNPGKQGDRFMLPA